jgi:hypothetical protein
MDVYQEIVSLYNFTASQPNRLYNQTECHGTVIVPTCPTGNDHATNVVTGSAQTASGGNFPDAQKNLALATAYLLEATKRDFSPLHSLKHTIGTSSGVRNAFGNVRPAFQRLARLRQIRIVAMGWKRLLLSSQPNDPLVIKAAAEAAELLKEVMK